MKDAPPKNGEFGSGKLWFERKGTMITLGLTNSAIESLGDVEDIEFPDEEQDVGKGEVVVTVEGSKGSLEVTAPAAGVVQEINSTAKDQPDVVSEDPLEEGWLVKLQIEDATDLHDLDS